jgi:hypothetical protein
MRVADHITLKLGNTVVRGAFLKFDGVAACPGGMVDQGQRRVQRSIVIDSHLCDDIDGMAIAHLSVTDQDVRSAGIICLCVWIKFRHNSLSMERLLHR